MDKDKNTDKGNASRGWITWQQSRELVDQLSKARDRKFDRLVRTVDDLEAAVTTFRAMLEDCTAADSDKHCHTMDQAAVDEGDLLLPSISRAETLLNRSTSVLTSLQDLEATEAKFRMMEDLLFRVETLIKAAQSSDRGD